MTRARRRASLMTTAPRGSSPAVALAGIDDAVLDHPRRRRAGVPEQRVEVGHVDEQRGRRGRRPGGASRRSGPGARCARRRRRGRRARAGGRASPRASRSSSCGRWSTHDVERARRAAPRAAARSRGRGPARTCARSRRRRARGPGSTGTTYSWSPWTKAVVQAPWTCQSRILTPPPPRARAARPRRATLVRGDAAEARVARDRADARAAAGARDVDEQQLVRHPPRPPAHRRAPSGRRARRPGCRPPRRGAPGRCCRRRRSARPASTLGELGERRPAAEVRDRRAAPGRRPARSARAPPGAPVTTTRRPAAASARTSSALRSGAHARAGTEAPGCTTTYRSPRRPRARRRAATRSAPSSPAGSGKPARRGEVERALDLVDVVGDAVADVEQRARVVDRGRRDERHAGQAQHAAPSAAGSGGRSRR